MTEHPDSPESSGIPPTVPPAAGPPPYPYAYPPGLAGPSGVQNPTGHLGPLGHAGPPPGVYPGGYPPPPVPYGDYYPGAPAATPRNGLGVTSLVLAIIALVGSCSVIGGLVLGIAAVVLGVLGRGRVQRGEATNGGVALTGIILGALAVLVSGAFLMFGIRVFNEYGGRDLLSCVQNAGGDNDVVQQCMDDFQQRVETQNGQTGG